MTPCAIVPSHNHWKVIGDVVGRLRQAGLPVFVIDDGSAEPAASAIAALDDPANGVTVHRLEVNQGKGAAVTLGFRLAGLAGFTHAVQVDADGQHDLDALPQLLALAAQQPEALITGVPQYDESIPTGRKIGRWVTHVWVWIETLSFAIADSMCGFRVYPLAAVNALLAEQAVGQRMDFDTDIMVRLFWRGTKVVNLPVKVIYPPDNTSNFDLVRDNLRISWMHTKLVVEMLLGLISHKPLPLAGRGWGGGLSRRLKALKHQALSWRADARIPHPIPSPQGGGVISTHWAGLAERGALWGLAFCTLAYRLLGRRGCLAVMAPIVGWFFLMGAEQRTASRIFLGRVFGRPASFAESYRHFLGFAAKALDTFIGWTGGIAPGAVTAANPEALAAAAADPRGAVIVVAHLGNVDIARALLDEATRARLTVLVHTRHAQNYNKVLRRFRPEAALNLLEVSEIGPETAITLKERVERGDWVVIAGDRTPIGSQGRVSEAPFLGAPARFSQGPWILAALLGCPVHLLFCLKEGDGWQLSLEPFAERVELPRGQREAALNGLVGRYAGRLEAYARLAPLQWYNFFDFWAR